MESKEKSTFGLDENIAGVVCYLGWWITGIVFLVCERENKTVRFHAMQSIIWFGALSVVLSIIVAFSKLWIIGFLFGIVGGIVGFAASLSWLFLMLSAYGNTKFKIPVIGSVVEGVVNK